MSRQPWLVIWVDNASGLARVKGLDAQRACALVSSVPPRRSRRGNGWVIPARHAADLAALGQCYRDLVVVVDRKQAPT